MNAPLAIKVASPLDLLDISDCYKGQIVYDPIAQKCFIYTDDGFEEIGRTPEPKPTETKDLICKNCGAPLRSTQCEYCGSYSWEAREFFRQ